MENRSRGRIYQEKSIQEFGEEVDYSWNQNIKSRYALMNPTNGLQASYVGQGEKESVFYISYSIQKKFGNLSR